MERKPGPRITRRTRYLLQTRQRADDRGIRSLHPETITPVYTRTYHSKHQGEDTVLCVVRSADEEENSTIESSCGSMRRNSIDSVGFWSPTTVECIFYRPVELHAFWSVFWFDLRISDVYGLLALKLLQDRSIEELFWPQCFYRTQRVPGDIVVAGVTSRRWLLRREFARFISTSRRQATPT